MKWLRVSKPLRPITRAGTYKDWKAQLAIEGGHQCVYCALPDARLGGRYFYHVEHFRPKSVHPELENEWSNLFYSCAICNVFKGDDWPSATSGVGYAPPTATDYGTLFDVDESTGELSTSPRLEPAQRRAAEYMRSMLYLDRPQLRLARREWFLRERFHSINRRVERIVTMLSAFVLQPSVAHYGIVVQLAASMARLNAVQRELWQAASFQPQDARRPSTRKRTSPVVESTAQETRRSSGGRSRANARRSMK